MTDGFLYLWDEPYSPDLADHGHGADEDHQLTLEQALEDLNAMPHIKASHTGEAFRITFTDCADEATEEDFALYFYDAQQAWDEAALMSAAVERDQRWAAKQEGR